MANTTNRTIEEYGCIWVVTWDAGVGSYSSPRSSYYLNKSSAVNFSRRLKQFYKTDARIWALETKEPVRVVDHRARLRTNNPDNRTPYGNKDPIF